MSDRSDHDSTSDRALTVRRITVVGASLAGLRAAETLRDRGFDGALTLIGDEPHRPYDRPPLSKQVLQGTWEPEQAFFRRKDGYDPLGLDMRLGVRATSVDLRARRVTLADGTHIDYDRLIIATGARVRTLPGIAPRPGLLTLRSLDDALALREALTRATRVAIVGAGFIGLEVAASCRARGVDVTAIESLPVPLAPIVGPTLGGLIAAMHRDHGVDLRTGVTVADVYGGSRVEGVALSDGSRVDADLVVVGIGVVPNTEWLDGSGLTLDDGIVCDGSCEAAPGVYAAGDVARVANAWYRRVPANRALDQRRGAGRARRRERAGRRASGHVLFVGAVLLVRPVPPQDPVHWPCPPPRRGGGGRRDPCRAKADGALSARRSRGGVSGRESAPGADQIQEAAGGPRLVGRRPVGSGLAVGSAGLVMARSA